MKASVAVLAAITGTGAPLAARAEGPEEEITLDTITVTATKRDERVQEVPAAVSVIGQEELKLVSPIRSNADIARSTPNFNYVDYGAQYSNVGIIRGVGSFSPLSAEDTSVVFNVDEIPRSAYAMPIPLLDMSQVEVLRGPQGTLYGRSSQAGAVNFVTNAPTFDREFSLRGEVGTNGYGLGELIANGALIDNLVAGRLAIQYNTKSGDVPNVVTGGEEGAFELGAGRGTLLWTPDTNTKATVSLNYAKSDDNSSRFVLFGENYPLSGTNPENTFDRKSYGANLRFEHAFDSFRFIAVSSVQQDDLEESMDLTDGLVFSAAIGLPATYFNKAGTDLVFFGMQDRTYLQEFRLASLESAPVSWTAGLNYYRSEFTSEQQGGTSWSVPSYAIYSGTQNNQQTTNSYAAFAETTVPVIGALKATLGLRATHQTNDIVYRFVGNGSAGTVPSFFQSAAITNDFLTGRAALSYDWSTTMMTYASIGRGAVPGGMPWTSTGAALGKDMPAYPMSTSWTYEAGFKSQLLDQRWTLNGAVFFNDVKNGHLLVVDSAFNFSTAALDYDSYGAELETRFILSPGLTLMGGLGYTHATLKDVPLDSPTGAQSGNLVPNVPDWTANAGVEYRTAATDLGLDQGEVFASAQYQYVGSRAADVQNRFTLASYGLVNGRLGWDRGAGSIYAFAYNLFDERYQTVGAYYGTDALTVRPGNGRIVGLGSRVRF